MPPPPMGVSAMTPITGFRQLGPWLRLSVLCTALQKLTSRKCGWPSLGVISSIFNKYHLHSVWIYWSQLYPFITPYQVEENYSMAILKAAYNFSLEYSFTALQTYVLQNNFDNECHMLTNQFIQTQVLDMGCYPWNSRLPGQHQPRPGSTGRCRASWPVPACQAAPLSRSRLGMAPQARELQGTGTAAPSPGSRSSNKDLHFRTMWQQAI